MTAERRNSIREFASRVRTNLNISIEEENIDLASVVQDLGGEIRPVPDDWEYKYDKVTKYDNPQFVIWINDKSVPARQRFSIAHEIGHLLIHMGYKTNPETWNRLQSGDGFFRLPQRNLPVEIEANEFAASFLMPEELFRKVADDTAKGNFYYTNEIATRLGVSEDAASYRGRLLGLWK